MSDVIIIVMATLIVLGLLGCAVGSVLDRHHHGLGLVKNSRLTVPPGRSTLTS